VGVAVVGDQRVFAHPLVGLMQLNASLPGQLHWPLARPMREFRVGRKGHRLGLNGGVDDHLGKVGRLGRAGALGDRKALLDQRNQPLRAQRWCQRVSDERSKVSLCWKNSSPQNS
jgi:hypothetical protein